MPWVVGSEINSCVKLSNKSIEILAPEDQFLNYVNNARYRKRAKKIYNEER